MLGPACQWPVCAFEAFDEAAVFRRIEENSQQARTLSMGMSSVRSSEERHVTRSCPGGNHIFHMIEIHFLDFKTQLQEQKSLE